MKNKSFGEKERDRQLVLDGSKTVGKSKREDALLKIFVSEDDTSFRE